MRTGYTDRLIDPPTARTALPFGPLLGGVRPDADEGDMPWRSLRSPTPPWKTALAWASLALISVTLTLWLLFGMSFGSSSTGRWDKAVAPHVVVGPTSANTPVAAGGNSTVMT